MAPYHLYPYLGAYFPRLRQPEYRYEYGLRFYTLTGSDAEEISLAVSGTGYSLLSTTCGSNPFDLNGTCTATVRFTPASAGSLSGNLTASWTNRDDVVASLSGTGVASCTSGTYTGGVAVTGSEYGYNTISSDSLKGQSFQVSSDGLLYAFVINKPTTASDTLTCRIGTSINLTTYIAEATYAASGTGLKEIVFTSHPALTAGVQYYFGCISADTGINVSNNSSNIANGDRFSGSEWANGSQISDSDMYYGVMLCQ